jgi:tRNA(adenine34) deaminase
VTAGGDWDAAMRLALAEAGVALGAGDVPVGAVVVASAGNPVGADASSETAPVIVAAAHNEREASQDPTAHAEVLALRRAARVIGSWRLDGLTLVVTLEPCSMCAGALVLARVRRLVYGAADRKAGAVGSLWDLVRDPRGTFRPEVIPDVLAAESAELLRSFFRQQRSVG